MRVLIDDAKCSGHGRCYTLSPEMFDCDDEGFPVILAPSFDAGGDRERQARLAVASCPERAISVVED
jgi:ferredoxin